MNSGMLAKWHSEIDKRLEAVCGEIFPRDEEIGNAARYVLLAGGKRLRGLLSLSVTHDLTPPGSAQFLMIDVAVALEILHAASLVHDDLPAIDNDDYRRGKFACHRAYSESTAILVGDALIGVAFSIIANTRVADKYKTMIIGTLADAWIKVCRGQVRDVTTGGRGVSREVMELKTGALFAASVVSGVVIANSVRSIEGEIDISPWREWGSELGVLFQRVDDLLDGEGGPSEMEQVQVDLAAELSILRQALLLDAQRKSRIIEETLALFIPEDLQRLLDPPG
jgi:geranylgeranyl diphosphate synthase type II